MVEKTEEEVVIIQSRNKPEDVPGRKWFPVRNNPLKPQQRTGWRLGEPATGEPLPIGGVGETVVEGSETESRHSPQFPSVDSKKMKRDFDDAGAPSKGAKID